MKLISTLQLVVPPVFWPHPRHWGGIIEMMITPETTPITVMIPTTPDRLHLSHMKPPRSMSIQAWLRSLPGWCTRRSSSVRPHPITRTTSLLTPTSTYQLVDLTESDAPSTMWVSRRCLIWQTGSITALSVFVMLILYFWWTLMDRWRIYTSELSPTCSIYLPKVFLCQSCMCSWSLLWWKTTQNWWETAIVCHGRQIKPYIY